MRSTSRTLKDHKRELIKFANLLGIKASSWEDINPNLILSESLIVKNDDTTTFWIPQLFLNTSLSANKLNKLSNAIFQPHIRLMTDQVMFSQSFNALVELRQKNGAERVPILSKGASYPSYLRDSRSTDIMPSENVWLLDLFTRGVEYCRMMGNYGAYIVIDTTYYEGWNRFSDKEFQSIVTKLPSSNPGSAVVDRYMAIINKPEYKYIIENIRIRGKYIQAIAKALGLKKTVRVEDTMHTKEYSTYLTKALGTTDAFNLFSKKPNDGDTSHLKDFSAFVYSEELSLRELLGIDGFMGPIREELPMSVKVLQLHNLTKSRPTPTMWYTRPGKFPDLNFSDSSNKVEKIFNDPQYERLILFMAENLMRAGLLEIKDYTSKDAKEVVSSLLKLMKEVEKHYKDL